MPQSFNQEFWTHIDRLVAESEIVIDRPRHSRHPEAHDMVYPLDYGYLAGTTSSDGSGIDVWVGANSGKQVNGVICTIDLVKKDSEIKLLVGCTEEEMRIIAQFVNQGDGMRGLLVWRN